MSILKSIEQWRQAHFTRKGRAERRRQKGIEVWNSIGDDWREKGNDYMAEQSYKIASLIARRRSE